MRRMSAGERQLWDKKLKHGRDLRRFVKKAKDYLLQRLRCGGAGETRISGTVVGFRLSKWLELAIDWALLFSAWA
jgi:hypothetical protein